MGSLGLLAQAGTGVFQIGDKVRILPNADVWLVKTIINGFEQPDQGFCVEHAMRFIQATVVRTGGSGLQVEIDNVVNGQPVNIFVTTKWESVVAGW